MRSRAKLRLNINHNGRSKIDIGERKGKNRCVCFDSLFGLYAGLLPLFMKTRQTGGNEMLNMARKKGLNELEGILKSARTFILHFPFSPRESCNSFSKGETS